MEWNMYLSRIPSYHFNDGKILDDYGIYSRILDFHHHIEGILHFVVI